MISQESSEGWIGIRRCSVRTGTPSLRRACSFAFMGFSQVHKRQRVSPTALMRFCNLCWVAISLFSHRSLIQTGNGKSLFVCLKRFAKLWSQNQAWNFWAISGITNPKLYKRGTKMFYINLLKRCWEFPF